MKPMSASKPTLIIKPLCYTKMRQLVLQSGDEIAWHGFVKRDGMVFTLYDIIMYPQYNSAATTKSDEEEYSKWILRQYDFDNFCDMKMHGHSHVNMACSPSTTDMQFRENILKNLKKDSFYIFMIMNKQGSYTVELYDYITGMIYDTTDITIYTDDPELTKKYINIADDLKIMGKLAHILRHRRKQRGSLDFDIAEAVITLDEDEDPISVELEERRTANRLIEEFMLVANETVAEHFFWLNYPFVYRIHEKPDPEKIMDLKTYLMNFGIRLKGSADNIYPKTLADIIADIEDKPYESVVNRVMLRTMKKACYSTECQGHFGLAFRYYCHFTSPIRRYPDLIIHRIIKESITGRMTEEKLAKYRGDTERAADISSKTERKAQELEREVDKMKKAQFMQGHIGEEFDGIVSGITDFGVYVELANTIEGMAFASELARPYQLGEKVRVRVMDARPQERQIDFKII